MHNTTTKKALTSSLLILGLALSVSGCSSQPAEPATAQGSLPPSHTDYLDEGSMSQSEWMEHEYGVEPLAEITYQQGEEYWFMTTTGALGKFTLGDEPVADFEQAREYVGAPEVTYITVTIDNRYGFDSVNFYGGISAYDSQGKEYHFDRATEHALEWDSMVEHDGPNGYDAEGNSLFYDLGENYYHVVDAGSIKTVVLAYEGTDFQGEFERVTVNSDHTDVIAYPMDHPEAQYVDLDFTAPQGQ